MCQLRRGGNILLFTVHNIRSRAPFEGKKVCSAVQLGQLVYDQQLLVLAWALEPRKVAVLQRKAHFHSHLFWVLVFNSVFCPVLEKHSADHNCSSFASHSTAVVPGKLCSRRANRSDIYD